MKTKLLSMYTENDVRYYLKAINAPIYLHKCPSDKDWFSVLRKNDADPLQTNFFVLDCLDIDDLTRDRLKKQILKIYGVESSNTSAVKSWFPKVIFEQVKGKSI